MELLDRIPADVSGALTPPDSGTSAPDRTTANGGNTRQTGAAQALRVLFLDHTAVPGGAEVALTTLLGALDRNAVTPRVVLCSHGPLEQMVSGLGVPVRVMELDQSVAQTRKDSLSGKGLMHAATIMAAVRFCWRLAAHLRAERVDLVHTNSLKAHILGGVAGRLARIPVLWHLHDRIERDYLPAPAVLGVRALARVLPTAIVANSLASLETLRLPASRQAGVVYCGVRHELLRHAAVGPRAARRRVGIVGRVSPWKGQHVFLQAAARVLKTHPDVAFLVVGAALFGEEAYERQLHELARELCLEEAVTFAGFQPNIGEVMESLDVLVHASTTPEPFGQVIIEAMALGKPVVATRAGGVAEIVVHGETGILVAPASVDELASAVCRLLDDPVSAQQMGAAGRRRVEETFTADHMARGMLEVYEKALFRRDTASAHV